MPEAEPRQALTDAQLADLEAWWRPRGADRRNPAAPDVLLLLDEIRGLRGEIDRLRWRLREWEDWYKRGEETCPSPEENR